MPAVLREIAQTRRGITVVTGPSGSGKSTTLAAIVDLLNETLYGKIVTIEDPIEILHPHKKALVAQREIGADVASMAEGIEQAMVQDADVIVAGELRDATTVRAALRAAETGHQIFATMFNPNATQVLERLIGMVPTEEKRSLRPSSPRPSRRSSPRSWRRPRRASDVRSSRFSAAASTPHGAFSRIAGTT